MELFKTAPFDGVFDDGPEDFGGIGVAWLRTASETSKRRYGFTRCSVVRLLLGANALPPNPAVRDSLFDVIAIMRGDLLGCCQAHRQSPRPQLLRKRARSQGPLLRRRYPASTLLRPCPTPAGPPSHPASELRPPTGTGSPDDPQAHYPGGSRRVHLSVASPSHATFPVTQPGRHPRHHFEACSGFTRVTAHWLAQPPKRPLSQGSDPPGCPDEPLASYQINRQLFGWILPPLVLRALGRTENRARSINRTNRGKFLLRVPTTCPRPVDGSRFGWAERAYPPARSQRVAMHPPVHWSQPPMLQRCQPHRLP